MLYLALYLPRLALDLAFLSHEPAEPCALVDHTRRPPRIHACTTAAAARGIAPGQPVAAALALAADLQLRARQIHNEQAALLRVAAWAQQFSPTVMVEAPDAVLLEIGSCLEYFGGLPRLLQRVTAAAGELGYHLVTGCAPSLPAALWLARHQQSRPVTQREALAEALAPLPVGCLPLTARQFDSLALLGLHTLGELLQMPRAGLARRFGQPLALLLEQALGEVPVVRPVFVTPAQFASRLELTWASDRCSDLLIVARHMLVELAGYLSGRGLGVQTFDLELEHENRSRSHLTIGVGRPTRQAEALVAVVRERLERCELNAPVAAMALRADVLHELDPLRQDLFDDGQSQQDLDLLHDRLRARLGDSALTGVAPAADHRPEQAWQRVDVGVALPPLQPPQRSPRPAWLLEPPQPLTVREHRPWYGEALHCLGRAERIESGWWDANPVRRDYFVARGQQSGRLVWIFRNCHDQQWFVHGLFD